MKLLDLWNLGVSSWSKSIKFVYHLKISGLAWPHEQHEWNRSISFTLSPFHIFDRRKIGILRIQSRQTPNDCPKFQFARKIPKNLTYFNKTVNMGQCYDIENNCVLLFLAQLQGESISVRSALSESAADSHRVKVKILNTASESSILVAKLCVVCLT